MTKKIFISGGAGFIGTNLISKLVKFNGFFITVYDDFQIRILILEKFLEMR